MKHPGESRVKKRDIKQQNKTSMHAHMTDQAQEEEIKAWKGNPDDGERIKR